MCRSTIKRLVPFLAASALMIAPAWTAGTDANAAKVMFDFGGVQPKALVTWEGGGRALGIGQVQFNRFIAASSFVGTSKTANAYDVSYYDIATGCVLAGRYSALDKKVSDLVLKAARHASKSVNILRVSIASFRNYADLLTAPASLARAPDECPRRIEATYGAAFDIAYRDFSALRRHTTAYLAGGPSALGDLSGQKRVVAERRLAKARQLLAKPVYLSYLTGDNHVILVYGNPGGTVKWLSEYTITSPGSWRFEMAVDGVLLSD